MRHPCNTKRQPGPDKLVLAFLFSSGKSGASLCVFLIHEIRNWKVHLKVAVKRFTATLNCELWILASHRLQPQTTFNLFPPCLVLGYSDISLVRKRPPLGLYSRPVPRSLWRYYGAGGRILMSKVPLQWAFTRRAPLKPFSRSQDS